MKLLVYALIESTAIAGDEDLCNQLFRCSSSAPRLIAEGYGRYLPGDFSRYLRAANGELKETCDALNDAVDRGYVSTKQIEPMIRLSRRASKAATRLIRYLRTAKAPHEAPRPRPKVSDEPKEPKEPKRTDRTTEPSEPNPLNP